MEEKRNSVTARWCGTADLSPVLKLKTVVDLKTGTWKQMQVRCCVFKSRLGLCIRECRVKKVEREAGAGNLILVFRA